MADLPDNRHNDLPSLLPSLLRRHQRIIGPAGGAAGVVIGIYSDTARQALDWLWTHLLTPYTLAAAQFVVIAVASWTLRGWVERRRQGRRQIVSRSFDIRLCDFEDDLTGDQTVIGRKLRYLERRTESKTLVVMLPGLGLDANDFRPYMNIAREHTVAVTLFGFNQSEAKDERYRPVSLATHVELVNWALGNLRRQYQHKRMVLVGFSIGADMIMRLGEFWQDHPGRNPDIHAMLLMDPNINRSSMVVSGALAGMDPADPLAELKKVSQTATNLTEFQNICEYLHKISKKDLAQIQRHAKDWWEYWEEAGRYDRFMQRIGRLYAHCPRIQVLFSAHYDGSFNEIVARARQHGMSHIFDSYGIDHFEFLNEQFLAQKISAVTAAPARPPELARR
ncbi:MAG: alpha/beta hydrolase [Actinomycetes bacterium]